MALTPEDVVNKRFQPTKFREGYDQDEVDDFLDEVVVELRRLNQENEDLRQRLMAGESRIAELQRSGASNSQNSSTTDKAAAQAPAQAAPVAAVPAPQAYAAPVADDTADDSASTSNLLQLARRLHDEHVKEGAQKRDSLIAEGHATAARVVAEAETKQRTQIGLLEDQKSKLEQKIDELRTFEREYRQKLKGYIEGQLRELDASSSNKGAFVAAGAGNSDTPAAQTYQGFGG